MVGSTRPGIFTLPIAQDKEMCYTMGGVFFLEEKTQMTWDESKHPRDDDGKFTDGNGSYRQNTKYSSIHGDDQKNSIDDFRSMSTAELKQRQTIDTEDFLKDEYIGKSVGAKKSLYDEIKSGKRFRYEELLENPVVKEFEIKAQKAQQLAEKKPPLSDKEKEKYGKKFLEKAKSTPKQYRADIVMGLPAAGKSSAVVNSLKEKYGSFEFDNDEIKKLLPGYNEYGAAYVHNDSKAVQNYVMKAFNKGEELNGANLAIPIIGSEVDSVEKWVEQLQGAGYDIHIHHVGISNEESMNRMVSRAIKTGRYIPLEVIHKYGEKPKEVYEQLKKEGRKEVTFE